MNLFYVWAKSFWWKSVYEVLTKDDDDIKQQRDLSIPRDV